jgi:hypothetical protein
LLSDICSQLWPYCTSSHQPFKKGNFGWPNRVENAFQELKKVMTTTPKLSMLNFNDLFTIESDASGNDIGAILSQQGKPVAFISRALGTTKQLWSVYAKEMLAIILTIKMWRPFLLGWKFYIQTDQCNLKYLLEQRITTLEQ